MNPNQTLTKLLILCAKHGYDAVAIGMKHEAVPGSLNFPFEASEWVIAKPKAHQMAKIGSWPAIWSIAGKSGMTLVCGGPHRCQIENPPLHPQVWQLKKGKWVKIAEEV